MGRLLGSFENDEDHDIPELNKCPDCQTYFAGDNCPICGKPCPENMRAGNRPVVKQKKHKSKGGYTRTTFIPWYHRIWFLILMLFVSPVICIILTLTSPHEKPKKVLFVILAALMLVGRYAGPAIVSRILDREPALVNEKLSEDEYKAKCGDITAEELYRNSDEHKNGFVKIRLIVDEKLESWEQYRPVYYRCVSEDGKFAFLVRNCLVNASKNFIKGDVITVYGEMQGNTTVYFSTDDTTTEPTVNMAYVTIN